MPQKTASLIGRSKNYVFAHKIMSAFGVLVILGVGYWAYAKSQSGAAPVKYVLTTVQMGTVISTVSGSGQVSPSDQVTINPKASGAITAIYVHDGEKVSEGQAIAQIDTTTALQSLKSAQNNLKSSQLSLQKLQQPATTLSLTQAQDAIAKAQESENTAQSDLTQTYQNSYNDVVSTYLDLPNIMAGIKDIDIGTEASRGSQWNIDFYKSAVLGWDTNVSSYHDEAYTSYQGAFTAYTPAYTNYQTIGPDASTSTLEDLTKSTYTLAQSVFTALNNANTLVQFYEDQVKAHDQNPVSEADTSITNLNSYISKINTHLSALLNDTTAIQSDEQQIADDQRTIVEDQQSLQQLQNGPNTLDVQSSQLSVSQAQEAVSEAEQNLADYTIRAPFAGVLADFTLERGDNAGSGTSVATEIGSSQIADLSLNEVDAAKVAVGNKATLTFDAIPNLSLTGQVVDVSPLGAVSQGVVSYDIKISFDTQDSRVKAGMTVTADIETAVHSNVLTVPASAVKTVSGASVVQVFNPALPNPGGTSGVTSATPPQSVPVVVGISSNTVTEITSGLTEGEQIVSRTTGGTTVTTSSAAGAGTSGARGGFGGGGGGGGAAVFRAL